MIRESPMSVRVERKGCRAPGVVGENPRPRGTRGCASGCPLWAARPCTCHRPGPWGRMNALRPRQISYQRGDLVRSFTRLRPGPPDPGAGAAAAPACPVVTRLKSQVPGAAPHPPRALRSSLRGVCGLNRKPSLRTDSRIASHPAERWSTPAFRSCTREYFARA